MLTDKICLVGAGGHAKVVLDAMLSNVIIRDRIVIRDDAGQGDRELLGLPVTTPASPRFEETMRCGSFHVAIGDALVRKRKQQALENIGAVPLTITHPLAAISRYASIGDGSFVAAYAVLGPAVRLGSAVIVNHGAVVDHDCTVGDFTHIAPTATLGGAVQIGESVLIGAGANVLPGIRIGDGCLIGAGAVVTRDVEAGARVMGIPARVMQ